MTTLTILRVMLVTIACGLPGVERETVSKTVYERADSLQSRMQNKVFKTAVHANWLEGGTSFWYRNDLQGGAREFVFVDAANAERRPAFDHVKLAAALAKTTEKPVAADRLPFETIEIIEGSVRFTAFDKPWQYTAATGVVTEARGKPSPTAAAEPARSNRRGSRGNGNVPRGEDAPNGKLSAFIRDHNVFLREKASGKESAVTTEGNETDGYVPGVAWSPDSKRLVALRVARGDGRKVHLIASSPPDQTQPKLSSYDYLKPGDRIPITKPHLFDVTVGREIPIDDALFENPWEIDELRWATDSSRFTFAYNQRGHQVLRIIGVDASTGRAGAIVDEVCQTFFDYAAKRFAFYLDNSQEILWMSERDGWNHLYLIDSAAGKVQHQITKGEWVVRAVDHVDEVKRQIWFRAGGLIPGQDPYHLHYARVNFDGSGLVVLTAGDGTHEAAFSPDRAFLIDTFSRVDAPPVTELRRGEDGRLVIELERADASALLAAGWKAPERFKSKGRDGQTDIHGIIFRPTDFDPAKKYPVIEKIYAGPHDAHVPKRFSFFHHGQALAELGFVVVQIDGMGTNWRSKAFHDVCWKNLSDAGFPDRILWMKAAAAKDPAIDVTRVGIFGGSAGGQNALGALLFHGDFYKAAAADCGCHDNRMDKVWWNELWMSWPVGPHYAAQSNVTHAHKLRGSLLLTVGELDRNVDPASTMQVVHALIKAGKTFELVVFPNADHGTGSSPYGERRLRDFFVKHLQGLDPPDWNMDAADKVLKP